jgi:2-(1,2-epoxy-1,2-dihydrophenyl)acetyl-CoA isomerase
MSVVGTGAEAPSVRGAPGAPDSLLVDKQRGILSITLNRPEVANALSGVQRDNLSDLLDSASTDPEVRVVTLSAAGRHFCAGMDLTGMRQPKNLGRAGPDHYPGFVMAAMSSGAQRLINAVMDCMKPVVAVVQGPAAGLGLYMVLASDIIVASKEAAFVEAFQARGMVLHCGGAHLLISRLGMHRAKELVLCGGRLTGEEAYQLGLVNRLAEATKLEAAAEEVVSQLASGPTAALGLSKRLLNRAVGTDRATAFSEEAMAMEINSTTHDVAEGASSFREQRSPDFLGW